MAHIARCCISHVAWRMLNAASAMACIAWCTLLVGWVVATRRALRCEPDNLRCVACCTTYAARRRYAMATCYQKSDKEALHWLEKAAESGHAEAQYSTLSSSEV